MDKRASINTKATRATRATHATRTARASRTTPSNLTNTFILATIGISAIAWIIAFAGSIASSQSIQIFPKFTWWSLVFQLIAVIILPVLYFFDSIDNYHNLLMAILAISFIYTSNSTNNLVYLSDSATAAAATGFILLSMTNFLWMYILGSSPNANYLGGINNSQSVTYSQQPLALAPTPIRSHAYNDDAYSNMEDAHELAGFENPVINSSDFNDSAYRKSTPYTPHTDDSSLAEYIEAYPILVRGLYDYQASPDDVNELSFVKGEIFRVKNTNDNWWQGKNKQGEIGMCPSNYLEIIDSE